MGLDVVLFEISEKQQDELEEEENDTDQFSSIQ